MNFSILLYLGAVFSLGSSLETDMTKKISEDDDLLLLSVNFECNGKPNGFYANKELDCIIFHYCDGNKKYSYKCEDGKRFDVKSNSCENILTNDCKSSSEFEQRNSEHRLDREVRKIDYSFSHQNNDVPKKEPFSQEKKIYNNNLEPLSAFALLSPTIQDNVERMDSNLEASASHTQRQIHSVPGQHPPILHALNRVRIPGYSHPYPFYDSSTNIDNYGYSNFRTPSTFISQRDNLRDSNSGSNPISYVQPNPIQYPTTPPTYYYSSLEGNSNAFEHFSPVTESSHLIKNIHFSKIQNKHPEKHLDNYSHSTFSLFPPSHNNGISSRGRHFNGNSNSNIYAKTSQRKKPKPPSIFSHTPKTSSLTKPLTVTKPIKIPDDKFYSNKEEIKTIYYDKTYSHNNHNPFHDSVLDYPETILPQNNQFRNNDGINLHSNYRPSAYYQLNDYDMYTDHITTGKEIQRIRIASPVVSREKILAIKNSKSQYYPERNAAPLFQNERQQLIENNQNNVHRKHSDKKPYNNISDKEDELVLEFDDTFGEDNWANTKNSRELSTTKIETPYNDVSSDDNVRLKPIIGGRIPSRSLRRKNTRVRGRWDTKKLQNREQDNVKVNPIKKNKNSVDRKLVNPIYSDYASKEKSVMEVNEQNSLFAQKKDLTKRPTRKQEITTTATPSFTTITTTSSPAKPKSKPSIHRGSLKDRLNRLGARRKIRGRKRKNKQNSSSYKIKNSDINQIKSSGDEDQEIKNQRNTKPQENLKKTSPGTIRRIKSRISSLHRKKTRERKKLVAKPRPKVLLEKKDSKIDSEPITNVNQSTKNDQIESLKLGVDKVGSVSKKKKPMNPDVRARFKTFLARRKNLIKRGRNSNRPTIKEKVNQNAIKKDDSQQEKLNDLEEELNHSIENDEGVKEAKSGDNTANESEVMEKSIPLFREEIVVLLDDQYDPEADNQEINNHEIPQRIIQDSKLDSNSRENAEYNRPSNRQFRYTLRKDNDKLDSPDLPQEVEDNAITPSEVSIEKIADNDVDPVPASKHTIVWPYNFKQIVRMHPRHPSKIPLQIKTAESDILDKQESNFNAIFNSAIKVSLNTQKSTKEENVSIKENQDNTSDRPAINPNTEDISEEKDILKPVFSLDTVKDSRYKLQEERQISSFKNHDLKKLTKLTFIPFEMTTDEPLLPIQRLLGFV